MIKEYFSHNSEEEYIKIEDSKIVAVKNKNITVKSVRVFDDKNHTFALAAAKGNVSDDELEKKAVDLLSLKMAYNFEHESNLRAKFKKQKLNINDLETFTEKVLTDLKHISEKFVLSGTSTKSKTKHHLKNNLNLHLSNKKEMFSLDLSMQQKGSGNIMDTYTDLSGFELTDEKYAEFLKDTEFIANACMSKEVNLETKDYKILCNPNLIMRKLYSDVNGQEYEEKSSLLAGKLGEKIFHENLNIYESPNNEDTMTFAVYDHEGIIKVYDHVIIQDGVLKTIFYDKKNAKKYGKQSTGNGFRGYNTNCTIHSRGFIVKSNTTLPNATDLYSNDMVIVPFLSSGGDSLPNGNYSLPIQMGFVFQNGKFIGKTPQFTLTGNYLDSLNKDFLTLGKNDILKNLMSKTLLLCNSRVNLV